MRQTRWLVVPSGATGHRVRGRSDLRAFGPAWRFGSADRFGDGCLTVVEVHGLSHRRRVGDDMGDDIGDEFAGGHPHSVGRLLSVDVAGGDRKSTRLNSSHVAIPHGVYC